MKCVVEIVVLHPFEPRATILLVETEVSVIAWIKKRPTVAWVDTAGVLRYAIDRMDFVSHIEQSPDHVPSHKTGRTGHKDFTHD
ncbi:hypothetical protein MES4922_120022 [Mesorhizobium ventifaucium]|uniref:Uncharacterized protein n=1 Tax=Mesorhizobium ventifaucium TaxID=666020 RepID=A0ABN8JCG3_9HYPH|nr:hypothetical protein MES4922_120022 [Mesorhizobium ventifaucium]